MGCPAAALRCGRFCLRRRRTPGRLCRRVVTRSRARRPDSDAGRGERSEASDGGAPRYRRRFRDNNMDATGALGRKRCAAAAALGARHAGGGIPPALRQCTASTPRLAGPHAPRPGTPGPGRRHRGSAAAASTPRRVPPRWSLRFPAGCAPHRLTGPDTGPLVTAPQVA